MPGVSFEVRRIAHSAGAPRSQAGQPRRPSGRRPVPAVGSVRLPRHQTQVLGRCSSAAIYDRAGCKGGRQQGPARPQRGGRYASVNCPTSRSSSSAVCASSCAEAAICWVEAEVCSVEAETCSVDGGGLLGDGGDLADVSSHAARRVGDAADRRRRSARRASSCPRPRRRSRSNASRACSTVAAPSSVRRRAVLDDVDGAGGLGLDLVDQRRRSSRRRAGTPRPACAPPRRRRRSRGPARRRGRPRSRRSAPAGWSARRCR